MFEVYIISASYRCSFREFVFTGLLMRGQLLLMTDEAMELIYQDAIL